MTSIVTTQADISKLAYLIVNTSTSKHTKRVYTRTVNEFARWFMAQSEPLCKATVHAWRADLVDSGLSASSVNQRLSVVRKLVLEAADNGVMPYETAHAIARVKGVPKRGKRLGNWLSEEEAQALLDEPDASTHKGRRDRAIMGVLVGCGLRRGEVAGLTFDQIQRREGRWVVVDIEGKHHRIRSVALPFWCKRMIDAYANDLPDRAGHVFRQTNKHDVPQGDSITADTVRLIVRHYGSAIGQAALAPHDLRRTFAQWLRRESVAIEQISIVLGHASIKTTQEYLGIQQELKNAPNDRIRIRF